MNVKAEGIAAIASANTTASLESTYRLVAACKTDVGSAANVNNPVNVPPLI